VLRGRHCRPDLLRQQLHDAARARCAHVTTRGLRLERVLLRAAGRRGERLPVAVPRRRAAELRARDIKLRSKLGLCPSMRFHVRGGAVEALRVRARAARGRPARRREHQRRDYCGLDAQRCWGMGHLLGRDCAELDQERSAPAGMRGPNRPEFP
jgi:hypothetical protein